MNPTTICQTLCSRAECARADMPVFRLWSAWLLATVILSFASLLTISAASLHATTIVDLTSVGASGTINGAIYQQIDAQSTGTGTIDSFAQIQAQGNNDEQSGYNTTVNNTLDNGAPDNFNHSITLSEVPVVNISNTNYREFLLDINEADQGPASGRFISLDEVQLFMGGTANNSVETLSGSGILQHDGTLIYQMDAGMDNWVALDFQLNSGSGSGDMFLFVPDSLFAAFGPTDVVTLYSEFGQQGVDPSDGMGGNFIGNFGSSAGFEEWAVRVIPEPATLASLAIGLCCLGSYRRRQ